ncbi:hypothetical protein MTR67_048004 [Solanum verrucosum]|uniref:Uncharacterized protein n=1 Tax=Solanum verrucosum TaxID=315347 RepID=A0AAF0ZZL2_SOLVR|nr:hypothetical protein MTR67_048004 [Solanum verrucosum]
MCAGCGWPKREILEEAHGSRYSIHPGATKMYLDLREIYWWNDRGPQFTSHFWRSFQSGLGTRCRSPIGWFEVGEFSLLGPEVVYEATEKVQLIRDRLKTAHSRQKSYADNRKRDFEFEVGDWAYLKISPMKGVMRSGKKGKLSPRYVGPYEILKRVGKVAYELKLPIEMALVHQVFHIYMLKKCIGDPVSILPLEGLGVNENLSYEEVPVEGATWEAEADMKSRYPHLFPPTPSHS